MDEKTKVLIQIRNLITICAVSFMVIAITSVIQIVLSLKLEAPYKSFLEQSLLSKPELFYQKMKEFASSPDHAAAVEFFKQNEKTAVDEPYFYFYRGELSLNMQEYEKALTDLQRAEGMMPMWKKEWTGPLIERTQNGLKSVRQR